MLQTNSRGSERKLDQLTALGAMPDRVVAAQLSKPIVRASGTPRQGLIQSSSRKPGIFWKSDVLWVTNVKLCTRATEAIIRVGF